MVAAMAAGAGTRPDPRAHHAQVQGRRGELVTAIARHLGIGGSTPYRALDLERSRAGLLTAGQGIT